MAKAKKHKWTAAEVIDLLRERYDKAGNGNSSRYVFVEQVAPATGFATRATWIDAMVFSMWPSEGLSREAFEVKVTRSDFLNEINNPIKNAWFMANSHKFWYVTGPGVVNAADEVPEGCGWMLAQTGRLVIKKQATHRQIESKIDAEFFAAVARAMDKEKADAKRRMRAAVLEEEDLKHALETAKDLQAWFQAKGVIPSDRRYQAFAWTAKEELYELLGRALAGEGDAKLADLIDKRVRTLRDKVIDMLLEMTPYVADLLSESDNLGNHIGGYMGSGQDWSILSDLLDIPKRSRYGGDTWKKERKGRIEIIRRLLALSEQADAAADNQSPKDPT